MKEKKERGSKPGNALVTFFVTYIKKSKVGLEEFLTQSTEFIGEPKNDNGCVVNMTIRKIEEFERGKETTVIMNIEDQPRIEKVECEDRLDRFMHFSFHGTRFCVDRDNMTVTSDKKATFHEMAGMIDNGCYQLNVETSN